MTSTFTPPEVEKIDGVYHIKGRPRETFTILAHYHPSNIPGKSLIVASVECGPNAATPPHTHGGATIVALPVQGKVLNQMNSNEPVISVPGEFWYEAPGCHHQRSENVGGEERAKFMVVMVVDDEVVKDGYEGLVVMDAESEEKGLPAL